MRPSLTLLLLALSSNAAAQQTLTVLSSNATKAVVEDLGPRFEKSSGRKVVFKFANSAELKGRIEKGEAFDVAILTSPLIGELVALGKLTAATRTDVARAGAGMAVHPQATKPDISTADALKGALINAKSIAYVDQGATAVIMRSIFEKFGITEAMNAKTKLVDSAAHAVAAKEAELGFTQISEILNVPGAALAGPLPAGLQVYTTFQAAASAGSPSATAAAAFITFLTAPAAAQVIKDKGMEPSASRPVRLPPVAADQMNEAQKEAVADFKKTRGVEASGPFLVLLRSPELMMRTQSMGEYLRFRSALPPRLSEFVILLTAREWTQQYEWSVHQPIALKAGINPETVQAIADGRRPAAMSEEEAILYDFCQELHRNRNVSDTTYARAVAQFGEQGVIDTIGIAGYYSMLAMVLNTAGTPAGPSGPPALRPIPR